MSNPTSAYFNFKTNEFDYLAEPPADWSDYIPQSPAAQGLYGVLREMGKTPLEAAKDVLLACTGNKEAA